MSSPFEPTLVAWWRFGRELAREGPIRIVAPYLIREKLDSKVAGFRATPPEQWRWYRIDETLIVERPRPDDMIFGERSRIYYLIDEGLAVIEGIRLAPPNQRWGWYIHLVEIFHDASRDCWLMKDLFVDVLIDQTLADYRIIDLGDLADALDLGLISPAEATALLRRVDRLSREIAAGKFPGAAVERAREACRALGW